jgi:drug/metabolite transporter (DMT)-like permease
MRDGMLMCICGAVSFGLLAVVSKIAERKKCNTSALVVWIFAWAALFMLGQSFRVVGKFQMTWQVIVLAVGLGVCAAVAYFAFQTSIVRGKVTVGWLMMNLSAGVPALVSIWFYGEKLTSLRSIAFGLALVSLLCLFQGNRLEAQQRIRGEVQ